MDPFWAGPVRMFQPNLRLTDARGLDGSRLVRQVRDLGANAILANAGGIVAWYPTRLPYHWRNPLLRRDFVGEVTAEARRLGMRALLRMDWSCLVPAIALAHPDWLALDADGDPIVEWKGTANPLVRTCPNRPYWRTFAFRELEELMSRYPVDGFFFNAWDLPDCRCPECRGAARLGLGEPPPDRPDWDSEYGRAYLLWRGRRHAEFTKELNRRIKRFSPGTILTVDFHLTNDRPRHLGRAGWDGARLADAVDVITVEAFNFLDRSRPHWPHWAEEEARMIASFPSPKPGIVLLSGSERWMGRRPAQPPAAIAGDLDRIAAQGGNACVAVSGDLRQEDPAVLPVVRKTYRRFARVRRRVRPPRPRVALVYPQRSLDLVGGDRSGERVLASYRGWYEALRAAGASFSVLHDGVLEEALAARGPAALVLPDAACLSRSQCRAVDRWVRAGGRLAAEFETSRLDETGRRRVGFGLRCLGRRPGRTVEFPGTWFAVNRTARKRFGIAAAVFPVAGAFLVTRGRGAGALRLLGWRFNNKPEWSVPEAASDQYGLYERRAGRGFVRYLPWSAGGLAYTTGSPKILAFLPRLVA